MATSSTSSNPLRATVKPHAPLRDWQPVTSTVHFYIDVSPSAEAERIVVSPRFGVKYGSVQPKPGCAGENAVERMMRDAKALQITVGTNEIHRVMLTRKLAAMFLSRENILRLG